MMEELNPESFKVLAVLSQFQAALESQFNQMGEGVFRATDAERTVHVEINGYQWLTSLKIESGLLDQGYQLVEARINEALQNAQQAAQAYTKVSGDQLNAVLGKLAEQLPGA
ncbi:YbaB/EbfC family nucleoid-associated protein [Mycobacterium sp.]|uniref:YbaB/EbfC family nucleoid-associated protein n=1 Tax=Mycobacterium sp. TaxID=1785 RepID=UPI002C1B19E2|nr:YbaB/EbfC family nucleoid-associated protein [Mycobacterium sp.]HTQ18750.1 YbaB/EbfC family nucleoid-associated protein [Mycobacterium sp.]